MEMEKFVYLAFVSRTIILLCIVNNSCSLLAGRSTTFGKKEEGS
jgi:hypothetical protein